MWSNYLLVCIDLGENSEACRALTRVVEMRASKDGEDCIDMEVLDRLVGAVTNRPPPGSEAAKDEAHSPNAGIGLHHPLTRLFNQVILPRLSDSSRIYKSQARLLLWEGRFADALDANVKAYRASVVNDELVERKKDRWREAVEETRDVVDTLIALGPKAVDEEEKTLEAGEKSTWKDWKFQARSIVRSFMGEFHRCSFVYIHIYIFLYLHMGSSWRVRLLTTPVDFSFVRSHEGCVRGRARVGFVEGDVGRCEECLMTMMKHMMQHAFTNMARFLLISYDSKN